MQCLNIKNKEVAALLDEYTNILGNYDAAYYVLSENNGYGLDKAPNGEPSKLYNDLLSNYNNDHSMAIRAKSMVYSDNFKNWFGDWLNVVPSTEASHRLTSYLNNLVNRKNRFSKLAKVLLDNGAIPYNLKYFKIDNNREDIEGYSAMWHSLANLIEVLGNNVSQESIDKALLHELIHYNTEQLLQDYKNNKEIPTNQKEAVKRLYDIIEYSKNYLSKELQTNRDKYLEIAKRQSNTVNSRLFYAFDNNGSVEIDEFISEIFTNPGLQEVLNNIPYKESKQSLWDKIKNAISSIFGFNINSGSVLKEALKESSKLIQNNLNVSKVVDENGEPLVVYHTVSGDVVLQGQADFTVFDPNYESNKNYNSSFLYFTDNKLMSESYFDNNRVWENVDEVQKEIDRYDELLTKLIPKTSRSSYELVEDFAKRFNMSVDEYIKYSGFNTFEDFLKQNSSSYTHEGIIEQINNIKERIKFLTNIKNNPKLLIPTRAFFINERNPFIADAKGHYWDEISISNQNVDDIINKKKEANNYRKQLEEEAMNKFLDEDTIAILDYEELLEMLPPKVLSDITEEVNKKYSNIEDLESTRSLENKIKNNNEYDGTLIKNVKDWGSFNSFKYNWNEIKQTGTVVAVKNPNQIKSINNQGTFSTTDDNIYRSTTSNNQFKSKSVTYSDKFEKIFNTPLHNVEAEATGTDKTLVGRLFNNKSKTTAREILSRIKENKNLYQMVSVLEKLDDKFLDTEIYYQAEGANEVDAAAIYSQAFGKIIVYGDSRFRGKDGSADITILHELIHAATIQKIKDNPDVALSASNLLELTKRKLEEKYGISWERLQELEPSKYYGLSDVYEFFAELYSNSRFIEELSTLEAEGASKPVSILKSIVNWLLSIFSKYSNVKLNKTLYEQAAGELENILFNTEEYLDSYRYSDYLNDPVTFASINATNDPKNIKTILRNNATHISFDSDSHTYTNINTGEIYTPVSTVKDLNGYGADIEAMSEETLEYGKFAAEVGTAIHAEIHKLLTGEYTPEGNVKMSKEAKRMLKEIVLPKIMKKSDTLVASEAIIVNDAAKVAGTVDMLKVDKDGNVHLLDFKTKARTAFGKKKYGFDYYFSAKKETKKGGKPDSERHDYQLTMYKRMLELSGIKVDSKEVVPIEYTVDKNGIITEVWIPELDYAENGLIHHRVNNALENEINKSVFSGEKNDNEINNDNLLKQSEIVQNILKTLKNQLAIYRVKGYTTKSEILSSFINKLNSKEEDEVIVSYINQAVSLLKPLVDAYNNALENERNGKDNVWNLNMLENWKGYAESFYNLDDIQNFLFINPKALSNLSEKDRKSVTDALATAISYKNILENSYKSKGEKLWLNWITPFSTRIEAEYRRKAEIEYKKSIKGSNKAFDIQDMNNYIEKYVNDHRNEINLKSRELLRQQSKIATSSPVSAIGRWLDNIFESSDPIVGSMARAFHTNWMQANEEFNNKYRELVDLTTELENAFPQFKNDPSKLYSFMIEENIDGYSLISSLPASFINDYDRIKEEVKNNPSYETAKDRSKAIAAWLDNNAPVVNKKGLQSEKISAIDELFDAGIINQTEHDLLIKNEKKEGSMKKSWAKLVETGKLSESAADILRERFNKLNWKYRVPKADKYPNAKWDKLQALRKENPNNIVVRFYDFINELSKYGDSYVPDRFKLNNRLPGISKTTRERLKSNNALNELLNNVKNEFQLRADDTDKGMQMTDELDRPIKFVPIYFTNKLPKNEQSLDIATLYKEWFKSVNNYKYINSILPQMKYTKWVINSRKTIKTDSAGNPVKNVLSKIINNGDSDIDPTTNALITDENLIAQVNAWFDQVVYGETSQNLGTFFGLDAAKTIDVFQKYTSLKIMGLNFVSMVNNALVAEVQQAEEAIAGQYASVESYTRATSHYISDMPNILADVGARKKTSLTNLLNEKFGVFTDFSEGSMLENTKFKKLCNTSTLYFTTNLGEHEAQSRFLQACLMEKRALDKNGKDIGSMFDYFSVEDGKLVFDKDNKVANFSKSEQIAFGQRVTAILRKQHGNYADYSRVALSQTGYGKLLLNFRKWIYPTFGRRFSKEYYDEYGQTFSKGFYRDGGQFYYNKVMSFFERMRDEAKALEYAEKADWATMTEDEKANVKRFTTEMSIFFTGLALQTMISAALSGYDDKDEYAYMVLSHLDYQIFRLSTDISFYFNPSSFFKIVQSPIPSSSVIKGWSNLLETLLNPTEKFEKGDWKGEYKVKKRVMDLLPIVRQIYRLRNIDDEKQLLSII